ncbi:hypothetical protein IWQ60_000171 [Tieghemiomyces parasiticus]|uniref:Pre-rRNA-processing protein RIX1 n=1 Tax=Tieghemiomyces parasiticus TaxID=78921 RepID=A0A9W8AGL4_9FUNG|nr:hypothetical protein IWQ60_000171 [Tieghemiomyces parasiticus]
MYNYSREVDTLELVLQRYLLSEKHGADDLPAAVAILTARASLTAVFTNPNAEAGPTRRWTTALSDLLASKSPEARWVAAVLVRLTLRQVPLGLLIEPVRRWTTHLLALLTPTEWPQTLEVAIAALATIFSQAPAYVELRREVAATDLPRYLTILLTLATERPALRIPTLRTLVRLTPIYPTVVRAVSDRWTQACLTWLLEATLPTTAVRTYAARGLVALCHAGARTNQQTISPADRWRILGWELIGGVHLALDRLMAAVAEPYVARPATRALSLPTLPADYVRAYPRLVDHARAVVGALNALLAAETAFRVAVPVIPLLQLAARLASAGDGLTLKDQGDRTEFALFRALAPELNLLAIELTATVVTVLGQYLHLHLRQLGHITVSLLRNAASQPPLRVAVYTLLTLLLQTYGPGLVQTFPRRLYARLIVDVDGSDPGAAHTSSSGPASEIQISYRGSRGKRRRAGPSSALNAPAAPTDATRTRPCVAAVNVAAALLTTAGGFVPRVTRTALERSVLGHLLDDQIRGSDEDRDPHRRPALYRCLLALVMCPVTGSVSVLPHALPLFQAGLLGADRATRDVCREALAACDLLIHPRLPALPRTLADDDETPCDATEADDGVLLDHRPISRSPSPVPMEADPPASLVGGPSQPVAPITTSPSPRVGEQLGEWVALETTAEPTPHPMSADEDDLDATLPTDRVSPISRPSTAPIVASSGATAKAGCSDDDSLPEIVDDSSDDDM